MTQQVEDARVPQTDEDSLELAIQYLEAGNEEQVVPMLRRMADRGTADALELLAQCYASGTGAAWGRPGSGSEARPATKKPDRGRTSSQPSAASSW